MGRRPSGICGAYLLIAARMHKFRRTVREVVYIIKVTNHTIQNRLAEFKFTDLSRMSVEDFLKQDFLESSHDPPSFYRQLAEFQDMADEKSRKRKRKESGDGSDEEGDEIPTGRLTRHRRQSDAVPGADLSKAHEIEFRRDAEGFIIPPLPSQIPKDLGESKRGADEETTKEEHLERLVQDFGDEIDEGLDRQSEPRQGRGNSRSKPRLPIDAAWVNDEQDLEGQIEDIFNDPLTREHALAYSNAEQRARIHSHWAMMQRPQKQVSMSVDIGADEFADDLEVISCLLLPEEARIKETIWVNQNREWLRQHQEKVFRRKVEADRPKQTRRRRKRARMGEGQTSPASSAADAAIGVVKDRALSKRINYDAIRNLFPDGPGSEATSRKTSLAGSTLGLHDDEPPEESEAGEDIQEDHEEDFQHEFDENKEYVGEEFGGGGEFEGGYDDDDPDMDEEYGLNGDEN